MTDCRKIYTMSKNHKVLWSETYRDACLGIGKDKKSINNHSKDMYMRDAQNH